MTTEVPESLGEWHLLQRLGRGGMGEVWRAERVGPNGVRKRAALKRILPEFQTHKVLRERFLAEARTTSRLEHPNVVQVIDFDDKPELYLVLEFVEGSSLADLMRAAATGVAPLAPAAVLYLISEAAEGLDYAHRKTDEQGTPLRIVHRDVSPPNILLSFDGAVKVSDFGIARAADNTLRTQTGLTVGKLVYMAPEQAMGETIDHRADLFSLGVVLWEALTLRPLLPRTDAAQTLALLHSCTFEPPSKYNQALPPALDTLTLACLSRRPDARPASAGQLARSLRELLARWSPTYDARELSRVVRALTAQQSHPPAVVLTPVRPPSSALETEPTLVGHPDPPRPAMPATPQTRVPVDEPAPLPQPSHPAPQPAYTQPPQPAYAQPRAAQQAAMIPYAQPPVPQLPPYVSRVPVRRRKSYAWLWLVLVLVVLGGLAVTWILLTQYSLSP